MVQHRRAIQIETPRCVLVQTSSGLGRKNLPALEPVDLHPDAVPFDMPQAEARIAELAKLKPLDYELCREAVAKEMGLRVSFLDKAVQEFRGDSDDDNADPFEDVEPASDPVDGAALLAELQATVLRFCILPDHSAPLIAAWVLHAWAHESFDISPVLGIVSPEKRCGKTTALSVVSALTPRAMHAVNISASVLFRVHHEVEDDEPQSAGVLLLRDVAEIFEAKRQAGIGSTDLLNALCALEESPWSEWRGGRPISTRGIAKLLRPYGIEPKRDMTHRFYRRIDFTDAFNRYLSKGG